MNKRLILNALGKILMIAAGAMMLCLTVSLYYSDGDAMAFVKTIALTLLFALPMWLLSKPKDMNMRPREAVVAVAGTWVLISIFGCLPFMFSGLIQDFPSAFFECVSGFTTTGATVLTGFPERDFRGVFFWRSFTHWIGGMGILVLTLAILPTMSGRTSHLVQAESPGPSLSKLVPKMGDTAKLLYLIYTVLTAALIVLLVIAGMDWYDALIHAFGTAGTGGFSNHATSIGHFQSPLIDGIITVFMLVFGANFAVYYKIVASSWKEAVRSEELKIYLIIAGVSTLLMAFNILPMFGNFFQAIRYSGFQMASIMSTTGYATTDFNLWPQFSRTMIVLLMFIGACAGSTAGGLKVVRAILLGKMSMRLVGQTFRPRKVQVVRFEGKAMDEDMLSQVAVLFFAYIALLLVGTLLISLDNLYNFETNFTAALTCISNVGPGLGEVGPTGSFSGYSSFSKIVLSVIMLAGRLELFPILVLFHPAVWKRQ